MVIVLTNGNTLASELGASRGTAMRLVPAGPRAATLPPAAVLGARRGRVTGSVEAG